MRILPLFILLATSLITIAQTLPSKFQGDWLATCVVEKIDTNKIAVCGICPHISKGDNLETISSVILNFDNKDLTITTQEGSTSVPIRYNEKLEHLLFTNNGVTYDFSIMYIDVMSKVILKSQNGNIIYLERKNNMQSK
jgi:hypothetical protein